MDMPLVDITSPPWLNDYKIFSLHLLYLAAFLLCWDFLALQPFKLKKLNMLNKTYLILY